MPELVAFPGMLYSPRSTVRERLDESPPGWLGRILRRVLPGHVSAPLEFELRAARVRCGRERARRRYAGARDLLVRLGAGSAVPPGWLVLDLVPAPGVDLVYDCRKSLPFPDGSVRGIFSEHFLGRLDYTEEVPYFLAECHRVLRPGGVLRIVVPDFARYAEAYVAGSEREAGRGAGTRGATAMELLNDRFRLGFAEKYAYDFESLQRILLRHGFVDVQRKEAGVSPLPGIGLDDPELAARSLTVEGFRKGA